MSFLKKIIVRWDSPGSTETLVRLVSRCPLLIRLHLPNRRDMNSLLAAAAQHCHKLTHLSVFNMDRDPNGSSWNYALLKGMAGISEFCTYGYLLFYKSQF